MILFPFFSFFISPFSRGVRGFCSGVAAQSCAKHGGGSAFCVFFPCKHGGQRVRCDIFAPNTWGRRFFCPFFLGVLLGLLFLYCFWRGGPPKKFFSRNRSRKTWRRRSRGTRRREEEKEETRRRRRRRRRREEEEEDRRRRRRIIRRRRRRRRRKKEGKKEEKKGKKGKKGRQERKEQERKEREERRKQRKEEREEREEKKGRKERKKRGRKERNKREIVVSCNSGPLSEPPPNLSKGLIQTVLLSEVGFEGGFLYILHFFGVVFYVAPFSPLWRMEALETPCFLVFFLHFCSEKFLLPEPPPDEVFVDLEPFSNFRLKNAEKIANARGKKGGLNSLLLFFAPRVYSFLCGKISFPLQTLFWPQNGYCPETPFFVVYSRRQPFFKQIPSKKAVTRFPF